jgi:hypothetical protein
MKPEVAMTSTRSLVAVATLAVGGAAGLLPAHAATTQPAAPHHCPLPKFGPGRDYHPVFDAATFSPRITNTWTPMPVGRTYIYAGREGKTQMIDIVEASTRTKVIDGARTRAVNDRVLVNGRVTERTTDFYSQDQCGNVWYFGEKTAELNRHGQVTTRSGSFTAGVHGAQPGVYMQAHPQIGREFRQEWRLGSAEDRFHALSTNNKITVPAGTFRHVLRTQEKDGLEPGVIDNKYFAPGIGSVREQTVKGPTEVLHLVQILH